MFDQGSQSDEDPGFCGRRVTYSALLHNDIAVYARSISVADRESTE